jgi:hypothetical protein
MMSYTIHCISEAVSPITHMSGTAGNEGIVAREPVHTPKGVVMVPYLSGNALRHRCVREPMALWLIDRYELRGKLSLLQLNFLLHGGNLTMSTAHENTRRIADMHEYWPFLRLCGGTLPDQILCGAMDCWRGTLICEENRSVLRRCLPDIPDYRLLPGERFLSAYQYTRGDAKKTGIAKDRDDLQEQTNLMIYSGQSVTKGAMFHHGFALKHVSRIELGCLLLALRLWQSTGGTIGGNARLGHGRLDMSLAGMVDDDTAVAAYVEHVDSVRDDAIRWLDLAFSKSAGVGKKPSKGKSLLAAEEDGDG